jgi:hypothetical protein
LSRRASTGVSVSTADTGSAGSAVELDGGGTITRTAITRNVAVTGNALTGGRGVALHGGGLFTTYPVTRTATLIGRNAPDQCFGC